MRVLYIAGYHHLSQHRKVECLANTLDIDILHISEADGDRPSGQYPSADGQRHYFVRELPVRSLGHQGDPHRSFLWPPRFDLRQFKPHLIYIEAEQESLGTAQIACVRGQQAPHIPLICYSWQNILRRRSLLAKIVSQYTLRAVDHILCASQEAAQVLHRQNFRGGTSVLPLTGLDTRYIHRKLVPELAMRLSLGHPVIGYVGRLTEEKGVDSLLRAAAQLQNQPSSGPGATLQLLIVGSGPEKSSLQSLAQQLGLAAHCRFVDAVPYNEVADYMSLMDMLVLPSRTTPNWKEQFGRVLVEAMACQVAVIGSDSGAIPEVIGNAGRSFTEDNVESLATAIRELAEHPEARLALAERGFQRAMEHFTVERVAEQTLAIWKHVANLA